MTKTPLNLALDAGGSKVIALLYDRDFRLISTHRTGSLRSNTTPPEIVCQNIDRLIDEMELRGRPIDRIVGVADGALVERLQQICPVGKVSACGELELGMHAAELYGDGLLALSGTGATLFGRQNGKTVALGGYGAAVSDEGSGYWLGRQAFGAAIRHMQRRGMPTALTELIIEKIGQPGDDLTTAIFRIYGQNQHSPTALVASCAPLVSVAARRNDPAALDILTGAGRVLGEQLAALVKLNGFSRDLPITISGSVWRSHPALFREFVRILRQNGLSQPVTVPFFEPIIGGIIRHWREVRGDFTPAVRDDFRRTFAPHTFTVDEAVFTEGLAVVRA